jgi:hypothetical protein
MGVSPMSRAVRVLWGVLLNLAGLVTREPELTVDLKRVNAELRRAAVVGLEDDIGYRERVKQRMREGARCTHPPLIDRKKVLPFTALRITSQSAPLLVEHAPPPDDTWNSSPPRDVPAGSIQAV